MTYADFFAEIKGKFLKADVSDITEHLAFQFNIIGEAQGIFYIEVKDGVLKVEPYVYQERDAMFTCTAKTLEGIESGKLDPNQAVEEGMLKVEGNVDKALRLQELIESHRS
ncbi:MAG: SCP2 sterol-binding domain-containing protein [Agathobacter sp.]